MAGLIPMPSVSSVYEDQHVTKLKLYYDGWLALPADLRRTLNLGHDAVLEAELVDGTIVLRPAAKSQGKIKSAPEPHAGKPPALEMLSVSGGPTTAPEKRKPGRPRKAPADEQLKLGADSLPSETVPLADNEPERRPEAYGAEQSTPATTSRRPRGRPRRVATIPDSEPASLVSVGTGSELRRKVVLPSALHEHGPVRGRRSVRAIPSTGHEREERRPFRQVEVRKLGPGRGHNRPRGSQLQP